MLQVKNIKLKVSDLGIMCFSGSIRGAIAFGLAISIQTENKAHKEVIVSSTLVLVLFTCLIYGALMPFFIKYIKTFDEQNVEAEQIEEENLENTLLALDHPNFSKQYALKLEEIFLKPKT